MKKISKKYFVLVACLTFIIACFGIVTLNIGKGDIIYADGETNPKITAVSNIDEDYGFGGQLFVGGKTLRMNGTSVYSDTAFGVEGVILRASASEHFEFSHFDIYSGEFDAGVFAKDGEPIFEGAQNIFQLSLEDGKDYLVEVVFNSKIYDVEISTEYFGERIQEDSLNEFFTRTDANVGVSWGMTLGFENNLSSETARFCYAEIKYAYSENDYYRMALGNTQSITFGKGEGEFDLDLFVENGVMTVVGVYIDIVEVNLISTALIEDDSTLEVLTNSPVKTGEYMKLSNGAKKYYVDKGTTFTVRASDSSYFTFGGFSRVGEVISQTSYTYTAVINGDTTITAKFNGAKYRVYVRGIIYNEEDGSYGDYVEVGASVSFKVGEETIVNSMQGVLISTFNSLSNVKYNKIEGYRFVDIAIKSGKTYSGFESDYMDDEFIEKCVSNGEIVVVIKLVRQYSLNVTFPDLMKNLVKINRVGSTQQIDLTQEKYFDAGTKIQIKVEPLTNYYSFNGFTGVSSDDIDGNVAIITIGYNQVINLNFKAESFSLKSSSANNQFKFSKQQFSTNETIIITYNVISSNIIEDWKINGVSVSTWGDSARFNGNILIITLTPEFLADNKDYINLENGVFVITLNNELVTALSTGVLLAIIIPAVAIPLTIGILAIFIIINSKRKRVIRGMLTEKLHRDVIFNTGSFVQGVREGTLSGNVTDADVKQAMKDKKKKK